MSDSDRVADSAADLFDERVQEQRRVLTGAPQPARAAGKTSRR